MTPLETALLVVALLSIAGAVWRGVSKLASAVNRLTARIESWDRSVRKLEDHLDAHAAERRQLDRIEGKVNER